MGDSYKDGISHAGVFMKGIKNKPANIIHTVSPKYKSTVWPDLEHCVPFSVPNVNNPVDFHNIYNQERTTKMFRRQNHLMKNDFRVWGLLTWDKTKTEACNCAFWIFFFGKPIKTTGKGFRIDKRGTFSTWCINSLWTTFSHDAPITSLDDFKRKLDKFMEGTSILFIYYWNVPGVAEIKLGTPFPPMQQPPLFTRFLPYFLSLLAQSSYQCLLVLMATCWWW